MQDNQQHIHLHDRATIAQADCLAFMAAMPAGSIDAIVPDPPYGFSFMGREWDHAVPGRVYWEAALRVAKPGAHLLAFGGTRTFHRLACALEDAGWQLRDTIMWVYGSGFPKSLNVSKALDKHAETRAAAAKHDGWGTAIKPAWEPVTIARKPLDGTVATNVLAHGTGAINIDGCRVATNGETPSGTGAKSKGIWDLHSGSLFQGHPNITPLSGRFPANLIHDGSDEVLAGFPATKKYKRTNRGLQYSGCFGGTCDTGATPKEGTSSFRGYDDNGGSVARFFYCAKASKHDRDEGCDEFSSQPRPTLGNGIGGQPNQQKANNKNSHPTVKPVNLMRYLCRLVTPPGGLVFDPFMGSGSTGKGALLEGFRFLGCDLNAEAVAIAQARLTHVLRAGGCNAK